MHVLDVGANIGDYTLWFSRLVGSGRHIYSFEPSPRAFRFLTRNLAENRANNVTALNWALAEVDGCQEFFEASRATGHSSLARGAVPPGDECDVVEVRTVRLDTFVAAQQLKRLDFIKMDAQGAEHRVLLGALDTLRRFRPMCLLEFWPYGLTQHGTSPEALLAMLRSHWKTVTLVPRYSDFQEPGFEATDEQILTYCRRCEFCDLLLT
jgi:FkbM family methyltransferase